jgi:hypothetical protein
MTTCASGTDALAERLCSATAGALELYSIYLGNELGLYMYRLHPYPTPR